MTKQAAVHLDVKALVADVEAKRQRLKLSSRQLASNLGLSASTVRKLQAGTQGPDVDCMLTLLWFLHGRTMGARFTRYCVVGMTANKTT